MSIKCDCCRSTIFYAWCYQHQETGAIVCHDCIDWTESKLFKEIEVLDLLQEEYTGEEGL